MSAVPDDGPPKEGPDRAGPAAGGDDDGVRIRASRLKLGLLSIPCFYFMGVGLKALVLDGQVDTFTIGLSLIGLMAGLTVLYMGFDPKPVLEIDRRGITCRRPNVGLIPWEAIAGIGVGRAPIIRSVLLVAVDEQAASPELLARIRRQGGMSFLNPTLAHFRGRFQNCPTVQIRIAFLETSPKQIQRVLEEKVHYVGG